jgi:hypothetical protein
MGNLKGDLPQEYLRQNPLHRPIPLHSAKGMGKVRILIKENAGDGEILIGCRGVMQVHLF